MGTADEEDRAFARNIESTTGADFSKEDIDDNSPKDEDQIVSIIDNHAYTSYTMPKVSTKDSKKSTASDAKKRTKKDPNKPKRALSAYMFFVQDYRERIKAENPEATFGDVGKLLGIKWREMNENEKKPYEAKAKADKERADRENADYKAEGKASKKAAKADEESDDDE